MRKELELTLPNSCLNKAGMQELIFVLREHDVCAAGTIRDWAARRVRAGKNKAKGDPQIAEALSLAVAIDEKHGVKQVCNLCDTCDTSFFHEYHRIAKELADVAYWMYELLEHHRLLNPMYNQHKLAIDTVNKIEVRALLETVELEP